MPNLAFERTRVENDSWASSVAALSRAAQR